MAEVRQLMIGIIRRLLQNAILRASSRSSREEAVRAFGFLIHAGFRLESESSLSAGYVAIFRRGPVRIQAVMDRGDLEILFANTEDDAWYPQTHLLAAMRLPQSGNPIADLRRHLSLILIHLGAV